MKRFFCLRLDAAFWTAFQTVSLNGKTSGLDFLRGLFVLVLNDVCGHESGIKLNGSSVVIFVRPPSRSTLEDESWMRPGTGSH